MFVRRGLRLATDCANTATWRVRTSSLNTERRTGESSASRLWRPNSPVSRSTEGRSRQSRRIPGRRVCGSDFQGIGEPFKRNCPSRSAASHLDLNVSAGDPHRVALDCLPSGRPPASPGRDVELRPVPGAGLPGRAHRSLAGGGQCDAKRGRGGRHHLHRGRGHGELPAQSAISGRSGRSSCS
jgi:hypothetical protein